MSPVHAKGHGFGKNDLDVSAMDGVEAATMSRFQAIGTMGNAE